MVEKWGIVMAGVAYQRLKEIKDVESLSLMEIYAIFCAVDFDELMNTFTEMINDNIERLYLDEEFIKNYHLFFLDLLPKVVNNPEMMSSIRYHIAKQRNVVHDYLKKYTKLGTSKSREFYLLRSFERHLTRIIDNIVLKNDEISSEEFSIVWFAISELKEEDYVHFIFLSQPDSVNIVDAQNKPLIYHLVEYFCGNFDRFTQDDIKYYKRIFVKLLESDNLLVKDSDLLAILHILDENQRTATVDKKQFLNFLTLEIDRHYELINRDSHINAKSYCNKPYPVEIFKPLASDERYDLTDEFTFSIDYINNEKNKKYLYDDAFTIKKCLKGLHVMVHIPDLECFIERDGEIDNFMRGISSSVFKKEYHTPMLRYDIASKASLEAGNVRPCITFAMTMDYQGNILELDFYKSLIRVDYNLSCKIADDYMHNRCDERWRILNTFYRVAKKLRKNRGEKYSKRLPAALIMDELNIAVDLAVAAFFDKNSLVFPFKNRDKCNNDKVLEHLTICRKFAEKESLSSEGRNRLYSILESLHLVYYDSVNHGNVDYNGVAVGNVGNPLRDYISLESDRLIKDILIDNIGNYDYWNERVERDCIEYTEARNKILELK